MRYVLEAPVRAGLAPDAKEYRYAGSDTEAAGGAPLQAVGATAHVPTPGPAWRL